MIDLGIVLLIIGVLGALGCQLGGIPLAVRICLFTAVAGLILIVVGYVVPALHDDPPVTVGSAALPPTSQWV